MSVITKDLGIATAYGYAKSKGYTGTEEEFAELMASYADVAQQAEAAAQDAEDAKDAAITAKTAAQTAQTAAESAQAAAAGSAQTASTKASEASGSAQTAAGSATAAGNSATAAAGSATTAQTAAQTATTKASEASSSASAAGTAKTGAETARTGAQTAQAAAEAAQENAEAAAASVSASAAQIEQNTEDIAELKNDLNQFPNGTYPNMSVGNADQLTATVGIEDNTPYLFRTSGGSVDIGDREDVKKLVGGTIANNQQIKVPSRDLSKTENGVTITDNRDGTFTVSTDANGATADVYLAIQSVTITEGHKYTLLGTPSSGSSNTYYGYVTGGVLGRPDTGNGTIYIGNTTQSGTFVPVYVKSGTIITVPVKFAPKFCDLTLMLGATIADYVYSLHQATAGAGVAWLKKYFPAQFDSGYQAYDAGSLQSVSGLTEHKMVGFNQWDEQWENGSYADITGTKVDNANKVRCKNFIHVLPNTQYFCHLPTSLVALNVCWYDINKQFMFSDHEYGLRRDSVFTVPNGCYYMTFSTFGTSYTTYNHDICINLSDPTKNGTYEPYEAHTYPLDSDVVLRGFPKVDANGNLYYDGDEYLPDGTVNRRYGIVDLGTLAWTKESGHFYSEQVSGFKTISAGTPPDFVCAKYISASYVTVVADSTDKVIGMSNTPRIYVYDSSYTDAATFKAAMNGVMLTYKKATPTTETADPYQETQIVDDFGTEEFVLADGAFPVPVGHDTMYQNNLRAKLEMSPDSPDGDGLYVVQQESGENTYVPLASTSTIQDILTRLTALENA